MPYYWDRNAMKFTGIIRFFMVRGEGELAIMRDFPSALAARNELVSRGFKQISTVKVADVWQHEDIVADITYDMETAQWGEW